MAHSVQIFRIVLDYRELAREVTKRLRRRVSWQEVYDIHQGLRRDEGVSKAIRGVMSSCSIPTREGVLV